MLKCGPGQIQNLGDEESLLVIQVSVCYILKHLEDMKLMSLE